MPLDVLRSAKSDLSKHVAKNDIFSDKAFLSELEKIASEKGMRKEDALTMCYIYLDKIAAKFGDNKFVWNLIKFFVRKKIIERFDIIYSNKEVLRDIPALMKDNLIAIVPNHKSIFDFMVIPYYIVAEGNYMPIILAADVFDKFPLGQIFRRLGAYFVQRESKDALYTLIFSHYVMRILKYELIHMFFIEGGRNKSGGYSAPKTGLLYYILQGKKRFNNKKDLLFIPVSISYDYVPESKVVIAENLTGTKKNIFRSVAKYGSGKKLGNCYLRFNEPIKLSEIAKNSISETEIVNTLADRIMSSIKDNIIVSPVTLACYTVNSLTKTIPVEISLEEFSAKYKEHLAHLKKIQKDTSNINLDDIEKYLMFASDFRIILYDKYAKNISVLFESKPLIEYYSNGIAHFFG